jgi:glycosyltransferase involved in cell wall biosynthesis
MNSSEPIDVSVVIPTLGGPTLTETINSLNEGSMLPHEILICIPDGYLVKVTTWPSNVKVLLCPVKGQVAQRSYGFLHAKSAYVMQLDDDMILSFDCLKNLFSTIIDRNHPVAVAPLLVKKNNNQEICAEKKAISLRKRIYYWLANGHRGYQPGQIMLSGFALSPSRYEKKQIGKNATLTVGWLSGGCILHKKNNLVLENYYPFKGKAYCEDLIHSHLMKKNGVDLLVNLKAECKTEFFSIFQDSFKNFIQNAKRDFEARRYALKLSGRVNWRFYLIYFIFVVGYFFQNDKKACT